MGGMVCVGWMFLAWADDGRLYDDHHIYIYIHNLSINGRRRSGRGRQRSRPRRNTSGGGGWCRRRRTPSSAKSSKTSRTRPSPGQLWGFGEMCCVFGDEERAFVHKTGRSLHYTYVLFCVDASNRYESDPKLERMRKEEIRADDPMVRSCVFVDACRI